MNIDFLNRPSSQKNIQKKLSSTLKKILGFTPRNIKLYEIAFIHKSASIQHPDGSVINNERLEYLGDAILDAVISDLLYSLYPSKDEGSLTKMRSLIVKREKLNDLAARLGLNGLIVSNTESNKLVKNIPGNTFEALIGAIYLDRGFYKTKKFITQRILKSHFNLEKLEFENTDYKSQILEWMQKNKENITFEHETKNTADNTVQFITRVCLDRKVIGSGTGLTKKESEQQASKNALKYIGQKP